MILMLMIDDYNVWYVLRRPPPPPLSWENFPIFVQAYLTPLQKEGCVWVGDEDAVGDLLVILMQLLLLMLLLIMMAMVMMMMGNTNTSV